MRANVAILLSACLAGGCLTEEVEGIPGGTEVGAESQAIVGGQGAPFDDAVVMLSIGCTGTLIRPNVVLTAAHCLPTGTVYFGPEQGEFFAQRQVIDSFQSRRYGAGLYAGGDIALLRLESDAPESVEPLPFNDVLELTREEHKGAEVRTVGYGNTDGINNTGFGVRRQVVHNLLDVEAEFIKTGTQSKNTCQGDSGGPTFMEIDGVEHVIAVTSFGASGCQGESRQTRVDVFVQEFIAEVLDAWSGPCRTDGTCVQECPGFPDPDCDVCGVDGACSAGCDDKDLDCPLGLGPGELCSDREACESLACVAADDDPRVTYCSDECDPERPDDNYGCVAPFSACEQSDDGAYYCGFTGPSPGTQGASCDGADDCRSGMCADNGDLGDICVEPCGGGTACADGYTCQGLGNGTSACLPPEEPGICSTSGERFPVWWLGLGLALLVAVRRKRA